MICCSVCAGSYGKLVGGGAGAPLSSYRYSPYPLPTYASTAALTGTLLPLPLFFFVWFHFQFVDLDLGYRKALTELGLTDKPISNSLDSFKDYRHF
jgi:hypothetical protein